MKCGAFATGLKSSHWNDQLVARLLIPLLRFIRPETKKIFLKSRATDQKKAGPTKP
jgi:hypothetical protein